MVDKKKIEKAVKLLLEGMGEDPTREGLVDTPRRVAGMYEEVLAGMDADAKEHLS
jgi:GTP cyclohydrolase I